MGCQKTVPFLEGFFLQPPIPAFRIAELVFKSGINRKLEARKMILSIYLNQTIHKNQDSQYDLDRLPGKRHKVRVPGSAFKG